MTLIDTTDIYGFDGSAPALNRASRFGAAEGLLLPGRAGRRHGNEPLLASPIVTSSRCRRHHGDIAHGRRRRARTSARGTDAGPASPS